MGSPHKVMLVGERAIGTDQGQKFVYVVDKDNQVAYCRVTLGLVFDGLQAIEDGLKPGDRVVVNGLQRMRPGIQVKADEAAMAELAGPVQERDRQPDRHAQPVKKAVGAAAGPRLPNVPKPLTRVAARDLSLLYQPADLRRGAVDRDSYWPGGLPDSVAAHRPVPRHYAAHRAGVMLLPRHQCPGGGRHRGRARLSSRSTAWRTCSTCRRNARTTAPTC